MSRQPRSILFNPKVEYEVSTQDDVRFNVVKWVENDPTHYIVETVSYMGAIDYYCNCPARKSCKHIKMVKLFRQKRYAAAGYGRALNSMVFDGSGDAT